VLKAFNLKNFILGIGLASLITCSEGSTTPASTAAIVTTKPAALSAPSIYKPTQPNPEDVIKFGLVFGEIKQFYVHDKKDKELFENAIRGMLSGLDPHSVYLDEEDLKEFKSQTSGDFVGIGIEITSEKGMVKVIAPLDDTPAQKAGIQAGDYIIAVNGKPVIDLSANEVVRLIRGKPGTTITLSVISKNEKKPRELTITRQRIQIQSVKSKVLADNFGYIRISQFQENTGKDVVNAVKSLQQQTHGNLQGLIIDLRNNPGGLLDSAVEVVDVFLDSKKLGKNNLIVYTKGRFSEANSYFRADSEDLLKGKPIIVLINQGSASGSEIVAGALQDYKRAVIVGQRSFGKGSVQTLLPLDDKTAIKLTTALYYTPKGRSIQEEGIKPDVLVENLKVNKTKEDGLFFLKIREQNLKGHLKNGSAKKQSSEAANDEQAELANKDFQLYEALTILKALSLVNQTTGPNA